MDGRDSEATKSCTVLQEGKRRSRLREVLPDLREDDLKGSPVRIRRRLDLREGNSGGPRGSCCPRSSTCVPPFSCRFSDGYSRGISSRCRGVCLSIFAPILKSYPYMHLCKYYAWKQLESASPNPSCGRSSQGTSRAKFNRLAGGLSERPCDCCSRHVPCAKPSLKLADAAWLSAALARVYQVLARYLPACW